MSVFGNPFDGCGNLSDIDAVMAGLSDEFNLPFYSYLLIRGRKGRDELLLTNYDREWCDRYIAKTYREYDPVAVISRQSRLPFFWDQKSFLRPFAKDQRRVFHEARDFRITAGYSIPVSGPDGDIGVFSLVGSQPEHMVDVIREEAPRLSLLALQAHDKAVAINRGDGQGEPMADLSARELECLKWTAEGKTSEEIADIVSISTATVNYHLNKTIAKLNASNRHHAAIKAVRLGLI